MVLPCPECCEAGCVIFSDEFDDDLTGWTIESGDWTITDGRLTISEAGRITVDAVPSGGEGDSTKIETHIRCTADGTCTLTIREDDDGNRLGVEFTQEGTCLTMRLVSLDPGGTPDYFTPEVANFVTTDQEQLHVDLCFIQGAPIEQMDEFQDAYCSNGEGAPGAAWTTVPYSNCFGETDSTFNQGDFVTANPLTCTWSGFTELLGIPEGSIITGIEVGIVCTAGESDPGNEVRLTSLRLVGNSGSPSGDDKGANQVVSVAGPSTLGGGGVGDDWNAGLTWEDFLSGNFTVTAEWTCTDASPTFLDVVQIDSCLVTIYYTGPDRQPGRLIVRCSPVAGMPTGYTGTAMAAKTLHWGGTKAGITVNSGDWDWSEFTYLYELTSSPPNEVCPTCETPCFIFGDDYERTELGCHYEQLSGTWSVDDTAGELTCDATGELVVRHVTTQEDNAQVVTVTARFPSQTNECRLWASYDGDAGTVIEARFDYDHVAGNWVIEIYENGDLIDSAQVADATSFPFTAALTLCLLGNTVFAAIVGGSVLLNVETNLTDTPTGLQVGLEANSGMVFADLSSYQTPFNDTDCPPCGLGLDNCVVCEDGFGPENLLVNIRGISQRTICGHCFRLNGTFLLPGVVLESNGGPWAEQAPCDDNAMTDAAVCGWGGAITADSTDCFEPGGATFGIFAFLVRNNDTNQYWMYVRIGGPEVTDPSYTGDFAYIWLREPLGSFAEEPDCYQLLTDVSVPFLCTDDEDANFDCDGSSATAIVNAA